MHQVIYIHSEAPPKPGLGSACNGCGLCCLAEPCPLGVVLTGRRSGVCAALRWHEQTGIYRCGAVSEPATVLRSALPAPLRALDFVLAPVLGRFARRWIAAGVACDSSLQVEAHVNAGETPQRTS